MLGRGSSRACPHGLCKGCLDALQVEQFVPQRVIDGIGACFQVQLFVDFAAVRLDGFHGQEHFLADFLIGVPAGYQLQDFQFAAG